MAEQWEQWPNVLRTWASLGRELMASRSKSAADWNAVKRMIDAVRPKMEADAKKLQALLIRSREKLKPLEEPFDVDFGLHRWLKEEREEAYSDWLQWVMNQAKTPARIFRLFGAEVPKDLPQDVNLRIEREDHAEEGHEDHEGRLDLVVYYGSEALLVVEVKKGDAEDADTAKHAGYKRQHPKAQHVLLAVSAEEVDYDGFTFCSWAAVCIEIRRLAVELCKVEARVMAAAMVLAFAAAVEQNLMGFSAELVQSVCGGQRIYFNVAVVDYVHGFLNEQGDSSGT